jgi:hypothetical protein
MVEAENASEAISKCGTQDVFMIKFGSVDNVNIFQQDMLAKMERLQPVAETAEIAEVAAPTAV